MFALPFNISSQRTHIIKEHSIAGHHLFSGSLCRRPIKETTKSGELSFANRFITESASTQFDSKMVDTIPKETLGELKEAFSFFEKNEGDGAIPTKSLGAALRAMGLNPPESIVKAICDETDEDGSGTVKLNTFLLIAYGMLLKHADTEKEVRDAFMVYAPAGATADASGLSPAQSGSDPLSSPLAANASFVIGRVGISAPPPIVMSADDLRAALMGPGEPFSEVEFDELLRELDLMPGDDVALEDILRIVALEGVERNEAASAGRRRARTVMRGGGGAGGTTSGSPTTRPSRSISVAPLDMSARGGSTPLDLGVE